ncbi:probable prolyl 4-hydroxylase 10 [Cicer arietinum]|uniref:procollagen-proline 4-dioxygenase n=1 Tax=Cicer arietinum TaxID=3827 RepID=A0A1S2XEY4_CICAR|nr:probable prolyl 4-hydroxylase 10 [Cicer arietinum]
MAKSMQSHVWPRKSSLTTSHTLILTILVTFTFLILILLAFSIPKPNHLNFISRNAQRSKDKDSSEVERIWFEVISWEPRAFMYHNFLTKEECEHLMNIAKPSMQKSAVVDNETGKSLITSIRTSYGTFIERGHDKIVSNIEKRIAQVSLIPIEHGEGLQVLHYKVGQKYDTHGDFFMDNFSVRHGGQRIATMLMYLSDVEEGGETMFPYANRNFSSVPWWNQLSDCGKLGLSIKPKMGDALLFWSMNPNATLDLSSAHGSCPVIKGDKWSCAKWMHTDKMIN